jgi:ABC-2 type transport system permease protein
MTAIIIFFGLLIGLNCIPLLIRTTFPKAERTIKIILVASTILFLTFTIFAFNGYRLKGLYTFSTISWTFIVSTIAYFSIFKNTKKKLITVFLLTPLIVLSILTLLLGQLVYENKIDETNKITVTTGGFLACGEIIHITQTRFIIFDKDVFHIDNLCLIGINKIETVNLDDKNVEFLIYHSGEYDSENPYKYDVERKNGW